MPKISVIIPVYNGEQYLEECIDSVLNQTLSDVEVICVDDCSKDSSYQMLRQYAEKDKRVKAFHFDEPRSALQARKKAVLASDSEFIMFLDADDYLEPRACEILYEKAKKENVDILHFTTRILNCANLPESRIAYNEKLIRPYEGRIEGKKVFDACFEEKKYFIQLWNKVFKADLCKKAFADMEDKYLPKAQDLYSFFIMAYYAKSYLGWVSEPLHNYCFGRGVTGSSSMNLDKFERYCTQANIVKALQKFCEDKGVSKRYEPVINRYYRQWINECVNLWKKELPKTYSTEGLQILYRYWGCKDTLAQLARNFWYERRDIAGKLQDFPKLSLKDREVKTIAFYYFHYTIGGVQKVISLLAPMFVKMGYRVVIITDHKAEDTDFELPAGVERSTIFTHENVYNENLKERLDSWDKLIEQYHFDVILYNAWMSNLLMWDALYLKNAGIPFFIHAHNCFSFTVTKLGAMFAEKTRTFALTDGMIVLSEADKAFWDAYNTNVRYIPNPIAPDLLTAEGVAWSNKSLVWVARVSEEKQPWAIFPIMGKVAQAVPEAKLYLLGNFDDPKWKQMAIDNGIENNVVFCGLTPQVNEYYRKSSVFVSTSLYEGFPMTLIEAQAHKLPTVMFEMPHLMMGTRERGVISVDMSDCNSAANEIVRLLKDQEHWNANSRLAEASYEELKAYDMESAWQKLLSGESEPSAISGPVEDMIHTFVNYYIEGLKYQEEHNKELQQKMASRQTPIERSVSYRIGRVITFIPRAIRRTLNCCRDHGVGYTVKYAWDKVKRKLVRR